MHDGYFLHQALQQAQARKGFTAPNPAVGAVIVKAGRVIAVGTHWQAGQAHAEVAALAQVSDAQGATLYVTLEPCCHHGKTPPCVEAILKAKLARVVYGQQDPNPQVAGRGAWQLQQAGVVCDYQPTPAIDHFYRAYRYFLQQQRPWVCGKLAMTLDGKIATASSQPFAITGQGAQRFTHQQRLQHDAILTSVKTIEQDNPQLNVRLAHQAPSAKPIIVVDRQARLPVQAQIWQSSSRLIVVHSDLATDSRVQCLQQQGAETLAVAEDQHQLVLPSMLTAIGQLGFHDLWLEAGGTLFAQMASQGLLNEAYCYVAPMWRGVDGQSAFAAAPFFTQAHQRQWQILGSDVALHCLF